MTQLTTNLIAALTMMAPIAADLLSRAVEALR
jgi:hypothetical protein